MAAAVRGSSVVGGSGVTSLATGSFTSATGDTIAVWFNYGTSTDPTSVTDNKGNTYTQRTKVTRFGSFTSFLYTCENATGGAGTIVTLNIGFTEYPTLGAAAIQGVLTSGALDALQTSGTDTAQPWTLATGTLAQADEIVFGFIGSDSGGPSDSFTEGSGMTKLGEVVDSGLYWTGALAYAVVASTATYTQSWTNSGGGSNSTQIIVSFKASAGGGPVSAALTGAGATGAVGTTSPATSKALSGNAGTSSVGTVAASVSKALSGNAGTGGVGTVGRSVSIGLSGVGATGAVGSVSAGSDATAALTGVAGTGSVGSVAPASSVALTGAQGSGAVGTVASATSKAISGSAGTGSVGSVAPASSLAVTGNAGTGSSGTVGPNVTVALSGVAGTGAAGSVTAVTGGVIEALSGVEGAGQGGSVGIDIVVALSGVTATGLAGDVSLPSSGGGRDDSKAKTRKRVNELNKKILQAEVLEEAQEAVQVAVTKAKSVKKNANQGYDEDEDEALMLLL